VRLVHSTENARKNGNILSFKKSKDPSNHVAARGGELVHLVFLVYLVSLASLNKSNKIDQTRTTSQSPRALAISYWPSALTFIPFSVQEQGEGRRYGILEGAHLWSEHADSDRRRHAARV
jgi:hypothetical protein